MKRIKSYLIYTLLLATFLGLMNSCNPSNEGENTASDSIYTEDTPMVESEKSAEEAPLSEFKEESDEILPNEPYSPSPNTEEYEQIFENPYKLATQEPLSTFSIDVDNASYSNVRQFINNSQLPPAGAVRIEEMINYFNYDYPQPKDGHPFSINTEIASCPWNAKHKLVHIGLQGKNLNYRDIKPCNLVFLVDASGSMDEPTKLPLLKKSLKLLLEKLSNQDKIAIVAYAGAAGLVLPSTSAGKKATILAALEELEAGGSTAGGEGIELAYKIAKENLIEGGNNRVILATDGDFNVGVSDDESLVKLIEEKRKDDIFLTICGFGMGNYKDQKMEMISNFGNGNYFYIDNIKEAEKVFVTEMRANLFTIAKDVKIQIEFNPIKVKAYRLIGYENRVLKNEDFNDDTKDAGELGAGHTVTALYEIIPAGSEEVVSNQPNLKYQKSSTLISTGNNTDLLTIKFRYKAPQSSTSKLIEKSVSDQNLDFDNSSNNFRFSAAVAAFGLILRNSQYKGTSSFEQVLKLAKSSKGSDQEGYRAEFISLVEKCKLLQ
ncbi:MAG: VWA domain-containing protein [Microscillaceae bacterium]|nr:VWA domain-containing protein [Microscillaceae bacterium]